MSKRTLVDLSHTVESGMITYKGLPAPVICDYLSREQSRSRYAPGVTHNTERLFGLQVPDGVAITLNPREHTHYQWLPFAEAADRCFSPSNAEAILQLPQQTQQTREPAP